MLNDGGVHGGANVRSIGGMAGMESVKERFRDDAVGGVRLGVDSSCKRPVNSFSFRVQRRNVATYVG